MENFNVEECEKNIRFELKNGLNKKRKAEIRKKLECLSSEEVNRDIEAIYNILTPLLYDNLELYSDTLETLLYSLLEGKYVVDISDKIDINLKNKFNKFFRQAELALEFAEKYFRETISPDYLKYLDSVVFDTNKMIYNQDDILVENLSTGDILKRSERYSNINNIYFKILDECDEIIKQNKEYLEKYRELYTLAIELYINENDEYLQYIKQMEDLDKKINENYTKIPTTEELTSILKNDNI